MSLTLFTNIAEIITNQGVAQKKGIGVQEKDLSIISHGALLWDFKKGIQWIGKADAIPNMPNKKIKIVSLKNKTLAPAFVDCHTHLVFAGSRHEELALRLQGASYQDIAKTGGGILSTVKATRRASFSELYELSKKCLEILLKQGVGIIEIKSGYGLNWETEKKLLKVIQKLSAQTTMLIHSTFLGAHAFPPEFKKENYVHELIHNMLPMVKKEGLATACDVFFDEGYFNKQQTVSILEKALKLGLKIKLHADELANTGGAMLAGKMKALSADHLLKADLSGLKKMASAGTVAVLLPGTAFYLKFPYADMNKMRKAKVCTALASDFNPGSSPILNFPFILSLAIFQMGMTFSEAFAAATYGGACALGIQKEHGFLKVGLKPKIAIFNCPSYKALFSNVAHPGMCEVVL